VAIAIVEYDMRRVKRLTDCALPAVVPFLRVCGAGNANACGKRHKRDNQCSRR
jgi:hypothetical protein